MDGPPGEGALQAPDGAVAAKRIGELLIETDERDRFELSGRIKGLSETRGRGYRARPIRVVPGLYSR